MGDDLLPQVLERENAVLGPLTSGGKAKFAFNTSKDLVGVIRHLRSRSRGVLIDSNHNEPIEDEPTRTIEAALYGGVMFPHFGHFIAESIHRLWPIFQDAKYADVPVAFHPPFGVDKHPGYMREILDYVGLPADRIFLIEEPTRFRTLYIPVQRSILGRGALDEGYIGFLAAHAAGRRKAERRREHLFIGRESYLRTGSILGEPLLTRTLAATGAFDIITPEREKVADLVSWYEDARTLIFVEGSAIHTLELCSRIEAKVLVICKADSEIARKLHFGNMLSQKASDVRYFDDCERIVPLSSMPGDTKPYWPNASAYPNFPKLIDAISEISGVPIPQPSAEDVAEACLTSLGRLVLDDRASHKRMSDEQLGKLLRELRAQVASLHLL